MKENTLFAQVLATVSKYLKILVILVALGICVSGIRIVKSGEVALILRCGQLVGDTAEEQIHDSGLLFAFPYIIDEVITVPVGSVMELSVKTHFTPENTDTQDGGYVLTGDHNIAYLSASVKYMIEDPVKYALQVKDIEAMINGAVSSAMLTQAASTEVDELLTGGKDVFATKVMNQADSALADTGVTLTALELTQVSMPNEVRDVYNKVNSATVSAATTLESAQGRRNILIPNAQATAESLRASAKAQRTLDVSKAERALAEFWGLLEEYKVDPGTVRARVYSQKITELFGRIKNIRVVEDGETTVVLYP